MRKRLWIPAGALAICLAAPPAAGEEGQEVKTDMSKGGITWSSGDNSITFGIYVQARYTVDDKEQSDADAAGTTGAGKEDGVASSFDVKRIRPSVKGTMFRPWLRYNVSAELAQTSGDRDSKFKDAYLEFAKNPLATIRLGQFKVPFSLQELIGDYAQHFVDRGITNTFAPSRDQGAILTGTTKSRFFGYAVGLFNGSGESRSQDDSSLMYDARIWFDPLGEYKLTESSLDAEKNVFHAGVAYRGGEAARGGTTGVFDDVNHQDAWNLELAWKNRRCYATGEYFAQTTDFDNPPPALPSVDSSGWHVQGGVMAIPDRLDFGLRYAQVDPDDDVADDKLTELRGAVNHYWKGHNLKLQFDLARLKFEAANPTRGTRLVATAVTDLQARLQVQLLF